MSPRSEGLPLEPDPRSVALARRWIVDVCRQIDRTDLSDSAELGVSELVTNAILHAEPPFLIRLRGTEEHPRVEVRDGSVKPPRPAVDLNGEQPLTTTGRGLALVTMCSSAWGARIQADGKVVWFVPLPEPQTDARHEPLIEYDADPRPHAVPLTAPVEVKLLGLPRREFADFRSRYREIRRELRLLALAAGTRYPVASSLSELLDGFDEYFELDSDELRDLAASDDETADITVPVDRETIVSLAQMIDVLDLTETFARSERLLTPAATEEQTRFRRWYLGEFVAQGRRRPPTPWTP